MDNANGTAGLQLYDFGTREKWLAGRRAGIGASEVAILFGLAPASWGSPYKIWAEKTGRLERPVMDGEWLKWGHKLEPVIADEYAERTGRKLWDGGGPYVVAIDPQLEVLRSTPDRWVIEADGMPGNGLLQIKNAAWYMAHNWDDGIPEHIKVQEQSEMSTTGLAWASVACLSGGNSFRTEDMVRNDAFVAEIRDHVEWFWGFVKRNQPPPIDGSEATAKVLRKLHPLDSGDEIELPVAAGAWWQALCEAKDAIKAVEKVEGATKEEAENRLREAMGSATFGRLPDGRRLTLKVTERAGYVVKDTRYRTLRIESTKKGK